MPSLHNAYWVAMVANGSGLIAMVWPLVIRACGRWRARFHPLSCRRAGFSPVVLLSGVAQGSGWEMPNGSG